MAREILWYGCDPGSPRTHSEMTDAEFDASRLFRSGRARPDRAGAGGRAQAARARGGRADLALCVGRSLRGARPPLRGGDGLRRRAAARARLGGRLGQFRPRPVSPRRRRQGERRRCARRCAHAPGHPAATANLGALPAHHRRDRASRADCCGEPRTARRTMSARGSTSSPNCCNWERGADALALLDGAPALPEDPARVARLAPARSLALLQLRRPAEAARGAGGAGGARPRAAASSRRSGTGGTCCSRRHAAATRRRRRGGDAKWRRRSRRWGRRRVPEHRIMAHYDLAKILVGAGRAPRAFAHWSAGHALLAHQPAVLARAHARFIDARSRPSRRARFARAARAQWRSGAGVHRRHAALGHDACASRSSPRTRRCTAPASASRSRDAFDAARRRGADRRRCGSRPALDAAAAAYLAELHALAPGQDAASSTRCPATTCYLGLVGADAAGREDHPLRARPARHRPVDLHLPLPRRARLRARSRRSRLDHRPAASG